MWQLEAETGYNSLPDMGRFIDYLNTEKEDFFGAGEVFVGRAPGRLDLMGGIADYSGSLVLELPLGLATFVAAQPNPENILEIVSDEGSVRLSLAELLACESYEQAYSLLNRNPADSWAA